VIEEVARLSGWRQRLRCPRRPCRAARCGESGVSLIETLLALLIFGLIAVTFLGGVATGTKATSIGSDRAIAESLVRSQAEYVKSVPYVYDTTSYALDPTIDVPAGWSIPASAAEPLGGGSDGGIQEVTVSAARNGATVLSVVVYKVNR
jgi:type II secretory pathway pseudopilin PulG